MYLKYFIFKEKISNVSFKLRIEGWKSKETNNYINALFGCLKDVILGHIHGSKEYRKKVSTILLYSAV